MSFDLGIVLSLLLLVVTLFMLNWPRMDVIGLLALVALPASGILDTREAFAGFGDPNIALIAALFVVGDGLVRTGIARRLGDWLMSQAGSSEAKLIALLMLVVALLGSTMSSTGVVALFIPVALRIADRSGVSARRLLMPLSFAGLISGMLTLVATAPNLVVNSELVRSGYEGFGFFAFTPFGLPILILGIAYMMLARRWLGGTEAAAAPGRRERATLANLAAKYALEDRLLCVRVLPHSPLIGHSLIELRLRTRFRLNVLIFEKSAVKGRRVLGLNRSEQLDSGDLLIVEVLSAALDLDEVCGSLQLERLPFSSAFFLDHSRHFGMAEVLLPPESDLIGQSVVRAELRSKYETTVVGLRRNLEVIGKELVHETLQPGDTLLMVGPWKVIKALGADGQDFIVLNLPVEHREHSPHEKKAPFAVAALLLMIVLMVTGLVPNVVAALAACLVMGAFGCISMDSAYRSIHWPSLILIAGMMPFATALEKTGGIALIAGAFGGLSGGGDLYLALGLVFAMTVSIGLFVSNTATAILMTPVAISIAQTLKTSPYPFAMAVALAASTAFMTPVSSPVNTLVVEPGRYSFADFARVGVPFSLLVMAVSLLLIPWLMPFHPG